MLFIKRFASVVKAVPKAIAIIDGPSQVTYFQLYERARSLARHLDLINSGLMVGILMEKGVDYIISILAIHLSGRVAVPLDQSNPIERLKQMIEMINLPLCLINQSHDFEIISVLESETCFLHINTCAIGARGYDINFATMAESPAYVVFTSGTTGRPKPVMVPYQSLDALIEWMLREPQSTGTTLLCAAPGFDVSFQEIYSALCHGDTLLPVAGTQRKDLHTLIGLLSSHGVTRLFLPTSMLIPFVNFNLYDSDPLPKLAEVIVAGEQLRITPAVRRWFKAHVNCRLINHYGPSETHVVMTHYLDDEPEGWPDLPPIGQVTFNSTAYLLDDCLQSVAPGNQGQLHIAGRSLALGYLNMPALTAEKFVTHPETQERMYSTGDICVINEQGLYEYKGRIDRQCKVRGYRVELREIETVVTNSGLVDDCLMVASQSGPTTSLILYYTLKVYDQDISLRLHTHLSKHVPEYMVPSFYTKIAAIPLTSNGKVDIQKLPKIREQRSQRFSNYAAPKDELESMVCVLAAACFGLDQMGASDNFMEAGANSLTLISLLAELRYTLAHDFRQTDLFEHPTPRELCAAYKHSQNAQLPNAPEVSSRDYTLRTAAIHRSSQRKRG